MSLRDRQRAFYYDQLDKLFPGLRQKYEQGFGLRYEASANGAKELARLFNELCAKYNMATQVERYIVNRMTHREIECIMHLPGRHKKFSSVISLTSLSSAHRSTICSQALFEDRKGFINIIVLTFIPNVY
jgi:hypothetical protein